MSSSKPRPALIPGETRAYPVLPLRDMVVFPHTIAPLFVGRKKWLLAIEEVMRSDTFILLATQTNASDDDPATEAIYEVGTLASVLQVLKLPDATVKVLVEGAQRAKVVKYTDCNEYYEAEVVALGDTMGERVESEGLRALGHHRVRELREAQQEGAARGGRRRSADRGLCQARRHRGLAPGPQDSRPAGDPGDHGGHRAAGEGARPDGR